MADVRREMAMVEPLAKGSMAGFVLMKLRGRWAIPPECECVLLQGYALCLHRQGFGVILHKASAAAIRATIFLSAKSQYLQAVRTAKKLGRTTVDIPFKPQGDAPRPLAHAHAHTHAHTHTHTHAHAHTHTHANAQVQSRAHAHAHGPRRSHGPRPSKANPRPRPRQTQLPTFADLGALLATYPDEEDGEELYLMGYTLIPPNVMANFSSFPPWDAFDCAHKRGAAQGIIAVRATKNANERLQTISFSDVLGPESSLTCGAIMGAEAKCLGASRSAIDGVSP